MDPELIRKAIADISAEQDPTLKSFKLASFAALARARRETSKLVAPGIIRRNSSSKDKKLRKLFGGERGLPFTPTENL